MRELAGSTRWISSRTCPIGVARVIKGVQAVVCIMVPPRACADPTIGRHFLGLVAEFGNAALETEKVAEIAGFLERVTKGHTATFLAFLEMLARIPWSCPGSCHAQRGSTLRRLRTRICRRISSAGIAKSSSYLSPVFDSSITQRMLQDRRKARPALGNPQLLVTSVQL